MLVNPNYDAKLNILSLYIINVKLEFGLSIFVQVVVISIVLESDFQPRSKRISAQYNPIHEKKNLTFTECRLINLCLVFV